MVGLTRQQRQALYVVFLLLLLGWAVKAWRTAHPPTVAGSDKTAIGSGQALPANERGIQE